MDMIESDIVDLVSVFMSAFAVGFISGFILRVYRRASGYIPR